MKKTFLALGLCAITMFAFRTDKNNAQFVKDNFSYASKQLKNMLQEAEKNKLAFPRTINKEGKMVATNMYDWTPGFFDASHQ